MTKSEALRKAKSYKEQIHNLQFKIYTFARELEDMGNKEGEVLATESGFEFDVSANKMDELIDLLENN